MFSICVLCDFMYLIVLCVVAYIIALHVGPTSRCRARNTLNCISLNIDQIEFSNKNTGLNNALVSYYKHTALLYGKPYSRISIE